MAGLATLVARLDGTTTVSTTTDQQTRYPSPRRVDGNWQSLAPPRPAPVRTAIARVLIRRAVKKAGVRFEMPDGTFWGAASGPCLVVVDPKAFFTRLGRDGKIGFGEAYMAGDWDAPDLVAVLEVMARHVTSLIPARLQWVRRWYEPSLPANEDNDAHGARRNIERHYDLSNELFVLFLDESMTYSSALFEERDADLGRAQARKIDRLLDATGVGPGTRVLEIGTGWGELALRAARRGATVTTVTLSVAQAELARSRIAEAGLTGAIDVRVQDYRDVEGTFDAIVSVEMVEAVGEAWWPVYFGVLDERLAPGGRVGLQAILMAHDRFLATKDSWTWVHKYIFPGGLVPSQEAIRQTLVAHTSLRISDAYNFPISYADTLAEWRRRFDQNASSVEKLGFDQTFRRMWDFYLAYSEAGFRARLSRCGADSLDQR